MQHSLREQRSRARSCWEKSGVRERERERGRLNIASRDAVDQLVLRVSVAVFSGEVSLEPGHQRVGAQVEAQEHEKAYLE